MDSRRNKNKSMSKYGWLEFGNANIHKLRMIYSSSYNTLRHVLDGVAVYIQATDLSDVEKDEIANRM